MREKRVAPQAGKEHNVECCRGGQAFSREHTGWLVTEDGRSPEGTLCLRRLQEGGGGENMGQKGRVQAFSVFCLLSLTGQFAKNRWEEPEPQMRVWFGLVWASEETKGARLGREREGGTGVAAALCQRPGVLGLA